METMAENQRVIVKANPAFHGVVTRVAYEGQGGFVRMDGDEDPTNETYFSAGELDPEL
jgi:hypothetical protein